MRLGALLTPGNPAQLAQQAIQLEAAGFDSIWSAQAMGRGFLMVDPFVALSVAAGVTQKVELGTAILQLPLYNATDSALKAMSLHLVSGGRFLLGVGAGSTESDYTIHRQDFAQRFQVFEEGLQQLRQTLADGSANGGNIGTEGVPPQSAPQMLYGTWGKHVARAATEFDGWIASGMHRTPEQCAEAIVGYRKASGQRAVVSTIRVMPDTDLGALGDTLAAYAAAGFDDAVVMVLGDTPLNEIRKLVD